MSINDQYRKTSNKRAQKFFDRRVAMGRWSYDLDRASISFHAGRLYYELMLESGTIIGGFPPRLARLMVRRFNLSPKNKVNSHFFWYDLKITPSDMLEQISLPW